MGNQAFVFICICLVGYLEGVSTLSGARLIMTTRADSSLNTDLKRLNTWRRTETSEHIQNKGRPTDAFEQSQNKERLTETLEKSQNTGRLTETFEKSQNKGRLTESLEKSQNKGRLTATLEKSQNTGRPTETFDLSDNSRFSSKQKPPLVASGYVTDKAGYKCAYIVPGERSLHGRRYLIIRCSKGEGADAKFYGCDFYGFPTKCEWYNENANAILYYEAMAKSIASGNSGSCKVTWVKVQICPDVTFRRARKTGPDVKNDVN